MVCQKCTHLGVVVPGVHDLYNISRILFSNHSQIYTPQTCPNPTKPAYLQHCSCLLKVTCICLVFTTGLPKMETLQCENNAVSGRIRHLTRYSVMRMLWEPVHGQRRAHRHQLKIRIVLNPTLLNGIELCLGRKLRPQGRRRCCCWCCCR